MRLQEPICLHCHAGTDQWQSLVIYVFDVLSGKLFGDEPLQHTLEISNLAIEQSGTFMTRLIALIDKNHDLYVTPVVRPQFRKLGTLLHLWHVCVLALYSGDARLTPLLSANMVDSIRFCDDNPMLSSIVDGKLVIWYYPSAVFIDPDVLHLTKQERVGSAWGNNSQIQAFFDLQCTIRSESGAIITAGYACIVPDDAASAHSARGLCRSNISPYPSILLDLAAKKKWEDAIRLCRAAKSQELWACLAVMSVSGNDLNTAEVAYAAIDEVQSTLLNVGCSRNQC